jgi:hypothetical protein
MSHLEDIVQRARAAIIDTSTMLNRSYPPLLSQETKDRRRLDKLAEEVGEVVVAYGGLVGENPRKGLTHTREDVLEELLDVAAVALGAYEHLDGHRGQSMLELCGLIVQKRDRLADAIAANQEAP